MSKPNISENGHGTLFDWDNGNLKILVSRTETHSDGRITGEILISTNAAGFIGAHLHQEYPFNFTSGQPRARLAKKLNERYSELCDWDNVLEQLCVYTCQRQRQGEPAEEILSSDTISPPRWILKPLLIEKYPTVIYGERGSHKTGIALILSQMFAYGARLAEELPEFEPCNEEINTLYLDYESDRITIKFLLSRLQRGMRLAQLGIQYRRRFQPLAHDVDQVKQDIYNTDAKLLIIDSLGLAAGGDLNSTDSALSFWAALRQLDCTTLILAHTQKNAEKKTVYGNMFFENLARNIWELKKQQEPNSNELNLALFHRKPAPFQNYHAPLGLKLTFSGEENTASMVVAPGQPQSVHEFVQQMGIQAQILELLHDGPMQLQSLSEALKASENNTRVALSRLTKKSRIVKLSSGYALASKEINV